MAKLTRIVKKILLKGSHDRDSRKLESAHPPAVESLATRGLAQPTVDFSNLPIIDDDELRRRSEERARRKALVTVRRTGTGIAKERSNPSKYKSSVVLPKVKGFMTQEDTTVKPVAACIDFSDISKAQDKTASLPVKATPKVAKGTSSHKVIKSGAKSESRSKRKREARKDMWRRKYDFQNEAKRLVENFQKEDKHGKALGNLSNLHSEISTLEDILDSADRTAKAPSKHSRKALIRAKLRNKLLLQAAMKNV